jgi:hypothetical protein
MRHCRRFFIVALSVLLAASAVGVAQAEPSIQKDESLRRGETRATLDPGIFRDSRVRNAYRIARDVPWLLDSIYCYCYCDESFSHKSVLSCYVDRHAAM